MVAPAFAGSSLRELWKRRTQLINK